MIWATLAYVGVIWALGQWLAKRKGGDLGAFYIAQRKANWQWVGISMVGTAISGLTFISLPGSVRQDGWSYLQVLAGYTVGYSLVALLLIPRYYASTQASIYEYFRHRLGPHAEKLAAVTFLISRALATSVRLYLALRVLTYFFPDVAFSVLSLAALVVIYLYAQRGGTGTLIYTDLLQTMLFLGAGLLTLIFIGQELDGGTLRPKVIETNPHHVHFWLKDFIGGVLLAFTMTGLDQDQMQKMLSMASTRSAQKAILLYAGLLWPVKLLFLTLGSFLWLYVVEKNLPPPPQSDLLYSHLAQGVFPIWVSLLFVLGLTASTLSSVDGALVALTTVTLRNMLPSSWEKLGVKRLIFVSWMGIMWLITVYFYAYPPTKDALSTFLKLGAYTYGPLFGLFIFSIWAGGPLSIYRHTIWVVPLAFSLGLCVENGLGLELGYGVILWMAGWTLGGLWSLRLMASRQQKPDTGSANDGHTPRSAHD